MTSSLFSDHKPYLPYPKPFTSQPFLNCLFKNLSASGAFGNFKFNASHSKTLPGTLIATVPNRIASVIGPVCAKCDSVFAFFRQDRKSTRLNSSHVKISYAVFCLKKKKKQ